MLETWYLDDVKNKNDGGTSFEECILFISKCPICGQTIVGLREVRCGDGKEFFEVMVGARADRQISKCKMRKINSDYDLRQAKGTPCGFVHGVNKEIHKPRRPEKPSKKGKITKIRQYAVDQFGQSELRREIKVLGN